MQSGAQRSAQGDRKSCRNSYRARSAEFETVALEGAVAKERKREKEGGNTMRATIRIEYLYRDGTTAPAQAGLSARLVHRDGNGWQTLASGVIGEGGLFEASIELPEKLKSLIEADLRLHLPSLRGNNLAPVKLKEDAAGNLHGTAQFQSRERTAPSKDPQPDPEPTPTPPVEPTSLFAHLSTVFADIKEIPEPGSEDFAHAVEMAQRPAVDVARYFKALRFEPEFKNVIVSELPTLFALLWDRDDADHGDMLVRPSGAFADVIKRAIDAKIIDEHEKESPEQVDKALVKYRDEMHLQFASTADARGMAIAPLGRLRLDGSALFDHVLSGRPLSSAKVAEDRQANFDKAMRVWHAVHQYPPMFAKAHQALGWNKLFKARDLAVEDWHAFAEQLEADGYTGYPDSFAPDVEPEPLPPLDPEYPDDSAAANGDKGEEEVVPPTLAYARAISARLVGQPTREELLSDLTKAVGRPFREGLAVLKANPDFDVTDKAVDLHFHGDKALDEKPREQLKTLARLLRLSPDGDTKTQMVAELHKMGVHSGLQIIRMGKLDFLKHFENMEDMWQRLAVTVYCRASRIADGVAASRASLASAGVRDQAAYDTMVAALPALEIPVGQPVPPSTADGPLDPPDLQSLFGRMDSCACNHCQSVFSPSAYLYNLLHWMRSDIAGAWGVLEKRRPDIKLLKLSCLNSDRMLPYIDLVNEALSLERQLAFDDPSDVYGGITDAPNVETTWEEDILKLQPQFRYQKAEDDLKSPAFPLALPFDRSEVEGYAAFAAAGVSIAPFLVQHHAQNSTNPVAGELAAAELGISSEVAKLLYETYHTGFAWNQHTGVGTAPGKSIAKVLKAFNIDIDTLKRLIKLECILDDDVADFGKIKFLNDECSWDSAEFETAPSIGVPMARLILGLLRLSNELGEELEDLDRALVAFNGSPSGCVIDAGFLEFLAARKKLDEEGIAEPSTLYAYLKDISAAAASDKITVFAEAFGAPGTQDGIEAYFDATASAPFEQSDPVGSFWPQIRDARAFAATFRFPDRLPGVHLQSQGMSPADLAAHAEAALSDMISGLGLTDPSDPVPSQEVFASLADSYGISQQLCEDIHDRQDPALTFARDLTGVSTALRHDAYFHSLWMAALLEATNLPSATKDVIASACETDLFGGTGSLSADIRLEFASINRLSETWSVPIERLASLLWLSDLTTFDALAISASFPAYWSWAVSANAIERAEIALYLADATIRLGGDISLLKPISVDLNWAATTSTIAENNAARLLRETASFGSNYDECVERANRLRRRLRDALLAIRVPINSADTAEEDFYKHRLLDAEMQPCAMTSRLKQSTLSVQKLIHGAMLGLEGGIRPDDTDREQFSWRKNYRVWEAALKMFLYPENWLDPSFRVRKSPLLETASSAVMQDELSEESAEKVIHDYVSGLDEIANLDIRAMHVEKNTTPARIHVVGRTHNPPYNYFYRVRTDEGQWEAWQPIDIDIDGDHLFFAEYHRRLWLFWPIFAESEHKTVENKEAWPQIDKLFPADIASYENSIKVHDRLQFKDWIARREAAVDGKAPKLDLRLAYATLEQGAWQNKKICNPVLELGRSTAQSEEARFDGQLFTVDLEEKDIFLWPEELPNGDLAIHCSRRPRDPDERSIDGWMTELGHKETSFVISGCGGPTRLHYFENDPRIPNWNFFPHHWVHHRPAELRSNREKLSRDEGLGAENVYVRQSLGGDGSNQLKLIQRYPEPVELVYPAGRHALWENPFFIDDTKRVHFAEREETCRIVNRGGVAVHEVGQADTYRISRHYHPYACLMMGQLNAGGVGALYGRTDPSSGLRWQMENEDYFWPEYGPLFPVVDRPLDRADFDFSVNGSYSQYDWEWVFHLPMLIAWQLKSAGRFEDALNWLQFVFDPTDMTATWGKNRPWQIKPFVQDSPLSSPFMYLKLIGSGSGVPGYQQMREALDRQIKAWRRDPFAPERVAQHRIGAYKLSTALIYVETLIEWGDELFRRDTMESINEAVSLYTFAAELLGPRPDVVDKGHREDSQSFDELSQTTGWDDDLEAILLWPGDSVSCDDDACAPSMAGSLFPAGYFCVPQNKELPRLWDLVEDRLLKIRHCLNLAGERRQLALYAPEIDPGVLARARAAGISIEDVVAAVSDDQMPYRFQFLLGKAQDYCAEAKSLGGQLQAALEKKDAEELNLIRDSQGLAIQKLTRNLKKLSVEEAKQSLAALKHSLASAQIQKAFLDPRAQELMSSMEQQAQALTGSADAMAQQEQVARMVASVLRLIPDFYASYAPAVKTGGDAFGVSADVVGQMFGLKGSLLRSAASRTSTIASYTRRKEDWQNQLDQTEERIKELERQIIAAEIRFDSAARDLGAFDVQIEQAEAVHDFLSSKFSGEELYAWTERQLKDCYKGMYQLARKMALQAQLAFKNELWSDPAHTISPNHWDAGKAGFLAAEKLSFELKRLDEEYNTKRADLKLYELSRQVSLKLLDPVKLFELRDGNTIEFTLPDRLFTETFGGTGLVDFRLKGLSVFMPCSIGPAAKVALKLTLLESWEQRPDSGNWLATPPGDQITSKIITSTAQNDSGRFDANPNGESYLPFENAGAISKWRVELPSDPEFDPKTIADLVLSLRYTARDGEFDDGPTGVDPSSFPVSLRYDLREQFDELKKDPDANGKKWNDFFQPGKLEELTPYLYNGQSLAGSEIVYVLYDDNDVETYKEIASGPLSSTAPSGFSVADGLLMHKTSDSGATARAVRDVVLVRYLG